MKQIITLFIMLFACITSTYAVTSTVVANDNSTTNLTIDSQKSNGLFAKAATFVATKVNKIAKKFTNMNDDELITIILIFVFPPLAMYFYEGKEWTNRVTLNLILTLLFAFPGFIHALIVILGKK